MSHQEALSGFKSGKPSGWSWFQLYFTREGKLIRRYRELANGGVRETPAAIIDGGPVFEENGFLRKVPVEIERVPARPGEKWLFSFGEKTYTRNIEGVRAIDAGRTLAGYNG